MRINEESQAVDGWGGEVDIHDFVDTCNAKLMGHSDQRETCYGEIGAVIQHNWSYAQGAQPCL